MTKICNKCCCEKVLADFYIRKSGRKIGKLRSICKSCEKEIASLWGKENRAKARETERQRYKKDPKTKLRRNTKWRLNNPDKVKKMRRLWAEKPGVVQLNYRVSLNLRHRIWLALKGNGKSDSTINLLGCSIEQLRQHLEKQFRPGMSWETYGFWEIDHIRPCASFDLTDPVQQRECFHYSNLQPLWEIENLQKADNFS